MAIIFQMSKNKHSWFSQKKKLIKNVWPFSKCQQKSPACNIINFNVDENKYKLQFHSLACICYTPAFMPKGIQLSSFRLSICEFVPQLLSVTFVEFTLKFSAIVSLSGFISPTTQQKAFIFRPLVLCLLPIAMSFDPIFYAPAGAWGQNLGQWTLLKMKVCHSDL